MRDMEDYIRFFELVDEVMETPELTYEQITTYILKYGYNEGLNGPSTDPFAIEKFRAALAAQSTKNLLRDGVRNDNP